MENLEDWNILSKAKGMLDNDTIEDIAIILESKDSINEPKRCFDCINSKNKARIIVVLMSINDASLKVTTQNNIFIARANEGGGMLPYLEPEIKIFNQELSIYYQYTRSNTKYNFKFINKELHLISASDNYTHSVTGNYEHNIYNFIKRNLTTISGNISKNENIEKHKEIKLNTLKKLSELGVMYDWEVVENKFL